MDEVMCGEGNEWVGYNVDGMGEWNWGGFCGIMYWENCGDRGRKVEIYSLVI